MSRVAVIAPQSYVAASSSILSTIQILAENGYVVDLITLPSSEFPLPSFGDMVSVFTSPWNSRVLLPGVSFARYFLLCLRVCLKYKHRCYIGFQPEGLITGTLIGKVTHTPVICYSLEIRFLAPTSDLRWRIKKQWEIWAHRKAWLTIVQDEYRAESLLAANGIRNASVVLVPNSLVGPSPCGQSDYLRGKLGLLPSQRIALMAGAIEDWGMVVELAEAAQNWPSEWVLIIHGWSTDLAYMQQIRSLADGCKVFLSEGFLPQDQFDCMVRSADVGIAFYRNLSDNFYHISSGKTMQYLRCGLPVVAVNFPNLRELIEATGCGVCVPVPADTARAIRKVEANLKRFRDNVLTQYGKNDGFQKAFGEVLKRLSSLSEMSRV